MSTRNVAKAPSNSTDILFRAWIVEFITAMTTAGMIDTAATGQINTATVTRPTVANTMRGFKVFRFGDALQSSSPGFIKVNFGSGVNGPNDPSIWVSLGTQHDGAGNLSGNVIAEAQYTCTSNSASTLNCLSSGSSSAIRIVMFSNSSTIDPLMFFIERIKNDDGTDSDKGFTFFIQGYSSYTPNCGCLYKEGTGSSYTAGYSILSCPPIGNGADGADLGIYPPKYFKGTELNIGLNRLHYLVGDITDFTTFTVSLYGTAHTYMALNTVTLALPLTNFRNNYVGHAMRWE